MPCSQQQGKKLGKLTALTCAMFAADLRNVSYVNVWLWSGNLARFGKKDSPERLGLFLCGQPALETLITLMVRVGL